MTTTESLSVMINEDELSLVSRYDLELPDAATPNPIGDTVLEDATTELPPAHFSNKCNQCGMFPIIGNRYFLKGSVVGNGDGTNLCEADFRKLPEPERPKFKKVDPPTFPLSSNVTHASLCSIWRLRESPSPCVTTQKTTYSALSAKRQEKMRQRRPDLLIPSTFPPPPLHTIANLFRVLILTLSRWHRNRFLQLWKWGQGRHYTAASTCQIQNLSSVACLKWVLFFI